MIFSHVLRIEIVYDNIIIIIFTIKTLKKELLAFALPHVFTKKPFSLTTVKLCIDPTFPLLQYNILYRVQW